MYTNCLEVQCRKCQAQMTSAVPAQRWPLTIEYFRMDPSVLNRANLYIGQKHGDPLRRNASLKITCRKCKLESVCGVQTHSPSTNFRVQRTSSWKKISIKEIERIYSFLTNQNNTSQNGQRKGGSPKTRLNQTKHTRTSSNNLTPCETKRNQAQPKQSRRKNKRCSGKNLIEPQNDKKSQTKKRKENQQTATKPTDTIFKWKMLENPAEYNAWSNTIQKYEPKGKFGKFFRARPVEEINKNYCSTHVYLFVPYLTKQAYCLYCNFVKMFHKITPSCRRGLHIYFEKGQKGQMYCLECEFPQPHSSKTLEQIEKIKKERRNEYLLSLKTTSRGDAYNKAFLERNPGKFLDPKECGAHVYIMSQTPHPKIPRCLYCGEAKGGFLGELGCLDGIHHWTEGRNRGNMECATCDTAELYSWERSTPLL